MANGRGMMITVAIVFVIALIIVISMGLFDVWIFIGTLLLGLMYLFGYLYLVNHYKSMLEQDEREKSTKLKLDWCWDRVNEMLLRRPDGQGLEWRRGIGRRSEVKVFWDGIQNRTFRSMEGYLSDTQQIAVVIYDVDNDDIARYVANPSQDVLDDHWYGFKPVASRQSSMSGMSKWDRKRYDKYRKGRGVSIHFGDDNNEYDDFDKFDTSYKPDSNTVNNTVKALGDGRREEP